LNGKVDLHFSRVNPPEFCEICQEDRSYVTVAEGIVADDFYMTSRLSQQ